MTRWPGRFEEHSKTSLSRAACAPTTTTKIHSTWSRSSPVPSGSHRSRILDVGKQGTLLNNSNYRGGNFDMPWIWPEGLDTA